jgi:lipopolysaccharide/colanic/teichoic acid biosynthesis glycosyltransferase
MKDGVAVAPSGGDASRGFRMRFQATERAIDLARPTPYADTVAPAPAAAAVNALGDREEAEAPGAAWEAKSYPASATNPLTTAVVVTSERFAAFRRARAHEPPPMGPARRALDLIIALAALLAFAPVLAIISILIKIQDGGAIVFSQERIGRGGRRFRCYKFRSMWVDAESRLESLLESNVELRREWILSHKLQCDPRITRFGAFLRRTSLDELPQLINILSGDMSVVGPRPIVEAEIGHYGRWYRYYTAVTPGLTGLWQVTGRSGMSYRRRVAADRLYVRMHSLKSYTLILLRTVPAVLARRGAC